jgi:general L-amino acid transport system permease protein
MADATPAHRAPNPPTPAPAFWRDERVLRVVSQFVFLAAVLWLGYSLVQNMLESLRRQGVALGFGFLNDPSGFDIGQKLIEFTSSDSFARALQVGLVNTLVVCAVGILLSTVLGVLVGVARLSGNWLVNRMAWAFIEAMRNVPLLVLLVFLYTGVFLKLPRVRQAIELPGPVYLSNRGVALPWGMPSETFGAYLVVLAIALALAVAIGLALRARGRRSGRPQPSIIVSALAFVAVAVAGWVLLPKPPLSPDLPAIQGLNFRGGLSLSPEFMALLLGLVIYTAGFIGEVVRAGIQSVARGQTEAARALGLTRGQTLRLVVFPQALRLMVPPLTSQYLNLTKNSTLAVAIGYSDLFGVAGTVINQTGRAVEMIAVVMSLYLAVSLITAAVMNWYNRRVKLVER